MKVFYSDTFELPLPPNHRFPMSKYRLLRERIETSSLRQQCELRIPAAASDEQLMLVHQRQYVDRVVAGSLSDLEIRRIGFPWSPQMVERSRRSVGASVSAGFAALADGVSVNLAGGTHHAFPDAGQGYCVFNDVAVAARVLQQEGRVNRVLFVDCDVHQGNGTAAIAEQDENLFAFSMHCGENFPFRKATSDLDITLSHGADDAEYLAALGDALRQIAGTFDPDIVFYVSGADPFRGDRLGRLNLSKPGLAKRDETVYQFCRQLDVPIAVSMGGGYAPDVEDIVDIHFATVAEALANYRVRQ